MCDEGAHDDRDSDETRADASSASHDLDPELELFREYAATRERSVRNRLVEDYMGLAGHVVKRFSRDGRHDDDLRQVAMVGLVRAVDRFDPEHGSPFGAFAVPVIEGELKRHFRDRSWTIKVSRSAQELHLLVRNAVRELEQLDGRSPGVDRIAQHLRIERDDVVLGLAATSAARVGTLDVPAGDGAGAADRQAALGVFDRAFIDRENDVVLDDVLRRLPEREREIVRLRFYDDLSQTEIAERMGISQMHVSRLLRQTFEQLRSWMSDDLDRP
ncbi:MAG: SigB/SigF/SigG family RNA polymerase sigma factor [Ilumatobacter sp.]|uniref:SigB/SigF/SigG family RNA polymerase sigma factor n=1 Tax=Ilumatobacter sp. TaxID=1967498 RepID=UPI00391A51D6